MEAVDDRSIVPERGLVSAVAGAELVAEHPIAPVEVSGEDVVYRATCETLPLSTSE